MPQYVLATKDDFSGEADGQFRYIGTDEYVEINKPIFNPIFLTRLNDMFANTNVKGVRIPNMYGINSAIRMFENSQSPILDLSETDFSGVNIVTDMFKDAKASIGYARTQEDADKFNNSSNKPPELIFTVKPPEILFNFGGDIGFKELVTKEYADSLAENAGNNLGPVEPGENITLYEETGTKSSSSSTPIPLRECIVNVSGTIRVFNNLQRGNNQYNVFSQIFINGEAVGTLRQTTSTMPQAYAENINVQKGDILQLMLWRSSSAQAFNSAFSIKIDKLPNGIIDKLE